MEIQSILYKNFNMIEEIKFSDSLTIWKARYEFKDKERTKRAELQIITAEIELIEAFIDHASRLIYRAEQHQIIEQEK
jgi:hypothetical protein